jgi:hypothetical protein
MKAMRHNELLFLEMPNINTPFRPLDCRPSLVVAEQARAINPKIMIKTASSHHNFISSSYTTGF